MSRSRLPILSTKVSEDLFLLSVDSYYWLALVYGEVGFIAGRALFEVFNLFDLCERSLTFGACVDGYNFARPGVPNLAKRFWAGFYLDRFFMQSAADILLSPAKVNKVLARPTVACNLIVEHTAAE